MAKKTGTPNPLEFPIYAMVTMAILGFIVVGASFEVIKVWPQPQSVEPVCDWLSGGMWGLVGGGFFGFVLGFLTDDSHFPREAHDATTAAALSADQANR